MIKRQIQNLTYTERQALRLQLVKARTEGRGLRDVSDCLGIEIASLRAYCHNHGIPYVKVGKT